MERAHPSKTAEYFSCISTCIFRTKEEVRLSQDHRSVVGHAQSLHFETHIDQAASITELCSFRP